FLARLAPAQSSCDHEVENQKQIPIEADDDAFARTEDVPNGQSDNRFERRVNRPQHERADEMQLFKPLAGHTRLERVDVDDDIRKLWHRPADNLRCRWRKSCNPWLWSPFAGRDQSG